MQITVDDKTIFKELTITIKADDIEEIYGLILTFNTPLDSRIKSAKSLGSYVHTETIRRAINKVEMPLWQAVRTILPKVLTSLKANQCK